MKQLTTAVAVIYSPGRKLRTWQLASLFRVSGTERTLSGAHFKIWNTLRKTGGAQQIGPLSEQQAQLGWNQLCLALKTHKASWVTSPLIGLGLLPTSHPSHSPVSTLGTGSHPHNTPVLQGTLHLTSGCRSTPRVGLVL